MYSKLDNFNKIFKKQYPHYSMAKNDTALEFEAEGSNYRVYLPTGDINNDGSMDLTIQIDHILGGQPDDHATISISFDADGQFPAGKSPTVSYQMSDGTQIPNWAFYAVNGVTDIGGLVVGTAVGVVIGILSTPTGPGAPVIGTAAGIAAGIVTEVVLAGIAAAVSGGMDLFNYLSSKVTDLSDDGGSVYLAEVVAHTLIRTSTAALTYNGQTFEQTIEFDYDQFLDEMDQSEWDDKSGNAVKYKTDDEHYRTWKPDYSVNYQNMGLLVSAKIDGIRDNHTDDHVILACLFDYSGNLASVQVMLRMLNENTLDIGSLVWQGNDLVQITSSGMGPLTGYDNMPDAVHDLMNNTLKMYDNYDDFPNERKQLPHITKVNLQAIINSIVGHG